MNKRHPEFVARLEEHGLTNKRIINDEDRSLSFTGKNWKSTYMTDDKNIAEARFLIHYIKTN